MDYMSHRVGGGGGEATTVVALKSTSNFSPFLTDFICSMMQMFLMGGGGSGPGCRSAPRPPPKVSKGLYMPLGCRPIGDRQTGQEGPADQCSGFAQGPDCTTSQHPDKPDCVEGGGGGGGLVGALPHGGGGVSQGLGIRLFAFGGACWPLATAHSEQRGGGVTISGGVGVQPPPPPPRP